MDVVGDIRAKFEALRPLMDERMRRVWAAAEARAVGHGGVSVVAEATGMSRTTIVAGRAELDRQAMLEEPASWRLRRAGGGRKALTKKDATLLEDLQRLIEPATRGEPDSPLRWTCKSSTALAQALRQMVHEVSERSVLRLLEQLATACRPQASCASSRRIRIETPSSSTSTTG